MVTGWVAVGALPELLHHLGVLGMSLMVAGGLLYTLGAIAMRAQAPRPLAGCIRLPRGVPRLRGRGGRLALESHRLHRAAGGQVLRA